MTESPIATPEPAKKPCANCGAPMHGPFCYACGQPEKGMIRHLASVLSDVADTIFNVDSRIFRSILPLYFRPGFLTNEYFAGRRTRYVTPFRLFFFMCVISFFAIQMSLDVDDFKFDPGDEGSNGSISGAQNEADLRARTETKLKELAEAKARAPDAAKAEIDKAVTAVQKKSDKRLAWLKARDEAQAKGEKPPADDDTLSFDGTPWDPVAHPIEIGWLPAFANAKINEMAGRAKDNINAAKRDPRHLIAGVFSVLPQTLFVLMPLFAVLLKVVYIFKRRLYMEHLMVALHSHAFVCMSLLLLAIVYMLIGWTTTDAAAVVPLLKFLRAAIWTWIPVYLLIMQKRVYRQGWTMTVFKYGLIGFCYLFILSFGLAGALIASLTIT